MTQASVPVIDRTRLRRPARSRAAKYFFTGSACLLLAISFLGFSRFFLHGQAFPGRPITPAIKTLVISHAIAMTCWLFLLIIQTGLVAAGRRSLHMKLGRVGAVLAVIILTQGVFLAVRAMQVMPPDAVVLGFTRLPFMAIPFFTAIIFASFVAAGVIYRRKPRVHRAAMLLGTLVTMSASLSRITPLSELYLGTVWDRVLGPYAWTVALGVLLLAVRSVLLRALDRAFATGLVILTLSCIAVVQFSRTGAWAWFASQFIN